MAKKATTKTQDAAVVAEAAIGAIAHEAQQAAVTPEAPAAPVEAANVETKAKVRPELFTFGDKASTVRSGDTLQGAHLKAGKAWRAAGYRAPSVRNAALAALEAIADDDGNFTYTDAMAALKALADANQLGCSTPATRFSKFLRSGHVTPAE